MALIGILASSCDGSGEHAITLPVTSHQHSGTAVRLQAIDAVDDNVAWASGLRGTYARTIDGGSTWTSAIVPGAELLQFRDVAAFDSLTAYLLAAGPGSQSRIYKTTDGGESWHIQFTNHEPAAFFDCMAFWDPDNGLAFSDAVDGEFIIIQTKNGLTWDRILPDAVPDALPGEGGFAASGKCLLTQGDSTAWFGTGGSDVARVLKTTDRGATWSVATTPIVSGSSAGITALAFRDSLIGLAAGGDVSEVGGYSDNIAITEEGGRSWTLAGRPTFTGAIYGLASIGVGERSLLLAAGPEGLDYSLDNAHTWVALDTLGYWSVDIATATAAWAVGPEGSIARIGLQEHVKEEPANGS
jgi:photosystem II stability/assembly factor-like uncharacterized protein